MFAALVSHGRKPDNYKDKQGSANSTASGTMVHVRCHMVQHTGILPNAIDAACERRQPNRTLPSRRTWYIHVT